MNAPVEAKRRDTYTVPEIAERLGVCSKQAYQWANEGRIPAIRLGKRIVIPRPQYEAWLAGEAPTGQEATA